MEKQHITVLYLDAEYCFVVSLTLEDNSFFFAASVFVCIGFLLSLGLNFLLNVLQCFKFWNSGLVVWTSARSLYSMSDFCPWFFVSGSVKIWNIEIQFTDLQWQCLLKSAAVFCLFLCFGFFLVRGIITVSKFKIYIYILYLYIIPMCSIPIYRYRITRVGKDLWECPVQLPTSH